MRNLLIGFISILAAVGFTYEYWQQIAYVKTWLPIPQPVAQAVATDHVHTLIGETLTKNGVDCSTALVLDRGVCEASARAAGVPPARAPHIACTTTVEAGPLTGATIVTVTGISNIGKPYTSDILMLNVGKGPQFLDPIWWSGLNLTVESNPIAWQYDSRSPHCNKE